MLMDMGFNFEVGSSPVIGPDAANSEGQFLDVVRIRLAILKLPHRRYPLPRQATYT